ncbi:MAG: methyltransferase domain-containing protein [Oscillospiraceae bacterium]|nr:methyltransferase domain-containing protein [Oscillospiraceae bacterium]
MENLVFDPLYYEMIDRHYWDFRAKDYNESASNRLEPLAEKQAMMAEFEAKGMLSKTSRVLDLGCGPGLFTKELAKHADSVVALDISEEMLKYAKANNAEANNVTFAHQDWTKEEAVFYENEFDFVFANMAPAIYNEETLLKMISACKRGGYCYYSHFATRYCNITERIDNLFGITREFNRIQLMFDTLWKWGYFPSVSYVDKGGKGWISLEDALVYYQKEYDFPDSDLPKVREALLEITENGQIERITTFKKGILIWQKTF